MSVAPARYVEETIGRGDKGCVSWSRLPTLCRVDFHVISLYECNGQRGRLQVTL